MLQVLVADDEARTRIALKALLERSGYAVRSAESGARAWEILSESDPPQVAVLDWAMSEPSGLEICRKLSSRGDGPFVYTILLTAHSKETDVIHGFEAGANDYMCKPFNAGEFRSRIGAAARIVQYERELRQKNRRLAELANEMERLANERAKQLIHADRMITLGTMAAGIAHEINNPTTFISGNLQTLEMFWRDISDELSMIGGGGADSKVCFALRETPKLLEEMRSGVVRITRIVNSLRGYSRASAEKHTEVSVNKCVEEALTLCRNHIKHNVVTVPELAPDIPALRGDPTQLSQVLVNLFTNAVHAMGPEGGTLHVRTARNNGSAIVTVRDSGPGIDEAMVEKIWLPFYTTKDAGEGTGLGLPICQKIVEGHGGEMSVENHPEGGAMFTITLPLPKE